MAVSHEWLERARRLQSAGAFPLQPAEIAAVHANLFPSAEAVCQTCVSKLGDAWKRIAAWVRHHDPTSDSHFSPSRPTPMAEQKKAASSYRFKDDNTTYREFGSPTVFSSANLTDADVERIVKADPDARVYFDGFAEEVAETPKLSGLKKADLLAIYGQEIGTLTEEEGKSLTVTQLTEAIEKNRAETTE